VPVEASRMRVYVLLDLGYAMIGSVHNIVFRILNASKALVRKKFHNPTIYLISYFV
jgi:hypothetical protein